MGAIRSICVLGIFVWLAPLAGAQIALVGPDYYPASDCPECPPVYTTVELEYTLSQDIAVGGGLRLFLGYITDGVTLLNVRRKDWGRFQVDSPAEEGWCRVMNGAEAGSAVQQEEEAPFGFEVLSTDPERPFTAGMVFRFSLGDQNGGGPGWQVSPRASGIRILVQERADAKSEFETVYAKPRYPRIEVGGSQATRFRVVAQSMPQDGGDIQVRVVAMEGADSFTRNSPVVHSYTGRVRFFASEPDVVLPPFNQFRASDRGVKNYTISTQSDKPFTVTVVDMDDPEVQGTSNLIRVVPAGHKLSDKRIYWGSMHSHTALGGHALETPEFAHFYARRIAGLDFFTLSEHAEADISKGRFNWPALRQYAQEETVDGRFIVFGGYEWTSVTHGHRNVAFKHPEDVPIVASSGKPTGDDITISDIDQLIAHLAAYEAIAIPHHPAWQFGATFNYGAVKDSPTQPLVEMYSWHGSSERYDNPLPIQGSRDFQRAKGSGAYVQEALEAGYRFGFVGDSDNHVGRPASNIGQTHLSSFRYCRMGITGVYAPELTRDAIWDALVHRRTYATTGARIVAYFWVNDHFVGEEFTARGDRVIDVYVEGSDLLDKVDVLDGDEVLFSLAPYETRAAFTFVDTRPSRGTTHAYYVRARQIGALHPEQADPHWAWVSPIWVHTPLAPPQAEPRASR